MVAACQLLRRAVRMPGVRKKERNSSLKLPALRGRAEHNISIKLEFKEIKEVLKSKFD